MDDSASSKRGYHHGDLRNALVAAAAELAAKGGPASVTIRAAAREVGVTPTAAYRHFAGHEELLTAAKERALEELTTAMTKAVADRPATEGDAVRHALARFGAFGRGYLTFAQEEPGLFHTVFASASASSQSPPPFERTETSPYQLLVSALDDLVAVGYLTPDRRPITEFTAWAMVHGLATLLNGPLADLPANMRDEVVVRSMLVLGHGLKGNGLNKEQESLLTEELTELS
ncbi:TetR/AcrR family transcriptional regulator [Actinophytocola algeriensis]|uniref:AcrR family transcriptional regulator n=1 Tax=Actinophytocola algeriensis TaxID=1768010 RepID=A0A7W7Q2H3_9PSEU|nr:TetR/AcrR family transcriptional regulator [Actinophytocola algeriensis]MBB4905693.1 AcrR family transcriptional regulator [Actinophytocola algeriensis]MBE1472622.1 AcrR family transcriptional regulator [Actinophytocola algeriensis]